MIVRNLLKVKCQMTKIQTKLPLILGQTYVSRNVPLTKRRGGASALLPKKNTFHPKKKNKWEDARGKKHSPPFSRAREKKRQAFVDNEAREIMQLADDPVTLAHYEKLYQELAQPNLPVVGDLRLERSNPDIILKQIETGKRKPTQQNFTFLIRVFGQQNRFEEAYAIESLMKEANLPPHIYTYNALAWVAARDRSPSRIEDIMQQMISEDIQPTIVTWTIYIDALAKCNRLDDAFEAARTMRLRGFTWDEPVYTTLICGCLKAHRLGSAWNLWFKLKMSGITPDLLTYTAMLGACGISGQCEKALELLDEMELDQVPPNTLVFNNLFRSLGTSQALHHPAYLNMVEEAKNRMIGHQIQRNQRTYQELLTIWAKAGQVQPFQQTLAELKEEDWNLSRATYATILNGYAYLNSTGARGGLPIHKENTIGQKVGNVDFEDTPQYLGMTKTEIEEQESLASLDGFSEQAALLSSKDDGKFLEGSKGDLNGGMLGDGTEDMEGIEEDDEWDEDDGDNSEFMNGELSSESEIGKENEDDEEWDEYDIDDETMKDSDTDWEIESKPFHDPRMNRLLELVEDETATYKAYEDVFNMTKDEAERAFGSDSNDALNVLDWGSKKKGGDNKADKNSSLSGQFKGADMNVLSLEKSVDEEAVRETVDLNGNASDPEMIDDDWATEEPEVKTEFHQIYENPISNEQLSPRHLEHTDNEVKKPTSSSKVELGSMSLTERQNLHIWTAEHIFYNEIIEQKNMRPNHKILNSMVSVYAEALRLNKAESFAEGFGDYALSPNIKTYQILIRMCCRAKRFGRAEDMLKKMKTNNLLPDKKCYGPLLDSYAKHGKIEEALAILTEMHSLRMRPRETDVRYLRRICEQNDISHVGMPRDPVEWYKTGIKDYRSSKKKRDLKGNLAIKNASLRRR